MCSFLWVCSVCKTYLAVVVSDFIHGQIDMVCYYKLPQYFLGGFQRQRKLDER